VHRASRRPALVATRALSDGDADKWELAQAMMRMRRTQDEALELILNEVSTLSKEVRSLRAELDELKGGSNGGVVVNAPVGTEDKVVQPVGKSSPDRDVLNEMLNALIPESDPSPIVDERKPEPEPEETNDDLPPVVLDVAGWRGDGSDRSASWPMCKTGEDDLYLMATIQAALNEAGFWAGEEDEADMYFGPSTQEALCYFQASVGLPEVGYVDPETWRALLGEDKYAWGPAPGAIGFDEKAAQGRGLVGADFSFSRTERRGQGGEGVERDRGVDGG
jgi:murein L,D-transpeptidase YcbB/YkuD